MIPRLLIAFLAFLPSDASRTATFRHGLEGYLGTVDTELWEISPNTPLERNDTLTTDANNGGGESQGLLRFEGLVGVGRGQIPPGATVRSAKLTVIAFDPGTTVSLHRMLVPWDRSATWNNMVAGVSADGIEALKLRDGFTFGKIVMDKQAITFDVTDTVQAWVNGATNFGWVFLNANSNGWDFYTSEYADISLRPTLIVEYTSASH